MDQRRRASAARHFRFLPVVVLGVGVLAGPTRCIAQDACLVKVKASHNRVAADGTVCGEAQNKTCVFQLQLCLNQSGNGCAAAPMKKRVKAHGSCAAVRKLKVKPDGVNAVCSSPVEVKVKTKKKGTREGKCKIVASAKSTDKPPRRDVERVTLVCKPKPGDCPAPLTVGSTTTTTLPCLPACDCCVQPVTDLARCVGR